MSPAVAGARPSTPESIIETVLGYRKAKILLSAAQLDLFSHLENPLSARALARKLSLDPRSAEILLDALVAIGHLDKSGALYRNTEAGNRHLVKGRPGYIGDNLKYQEIIWDAWSQLGLCVKKGGAVRPLEYWLLKHKGFTPEYIRGMDNIARKPAAEIASLIDVSSGKRMLDIGAGPGTYSLAFLERNPALEATLFDLPSTLRITREVVRASPALAPRVRFQAGNYRADSFGREEYDLVLMSHITHDESPAVNLRLAQEAWRSLKPGGRIVVHDFIVDASRTRPEFGALFSVHMLTYTQNGRTYTAAEYKGWLRQAGFRRFREEQISSGARNSSQIIAAVK